MKIPFVKMHGLGNDYVYIDCFAPETSAQLAHADLPALARRVSDRHLGIGSDGLVLILPSTEADARMRIFNADGSEAEMCGNAIRCVGKYLYENDICHKPQLFIETLAGVRSLTLHVSTDIVEQVTVNMGIPVIQPDALPLDGDQLGFTSVNIGNPHAVFVRDSVGAMENIAKAGTRIGTHPHFPHGTNVEFVYVRNATELDVRVWERGSGETLACGTGACAAAVTAIWHGWTERNLIVHLLGGDLAIKWEMDGHAVYMTGSATEVFRGTFEM